MNYKGIAPPPPPKGGFLEYYVKMRIHTLITLFKSIKVSWGTDIIPQNIHDIPTFGLNEGNIKEHSMERRQSHRKVL